MKKVSVLVFVTLAFFACKDQLEPESVSQQTAQGEQTTDNQQAVSYELQETGDTFMKHVSNVGAANFYVSKYAAFTPSVNGADVNGLLYTDYGFNAPQCWHYGSDNVRFVNRTDGSSTNGTATFSIPNNYTFVPSSGIWKIENVPDEVFYSTFQSMSNAALAKIAKDSLNAINANSVYVNYVYADISANGGSWSETSDHAGIISKGASTQLSYSDCGFFEGITPVAGAAGKYEIYPYVGGNEAHRIKTPSEPTAFKGTGYIYVMPIDDDGLFMRGGKAGKYGLQMFKTDSLVASYSYWDDADTLLMNFNNWYTVRVIRQHASGQMIVGFSGYPMVPTFQKDMWGVHDEENNFVATTQIAPNGVEYFSDVSESSDNSKYISVTKPLYYGKSSDITTGLDNVYCAPKRAKAAIDTGIPDDVIISGEFKEYRFVPAGYTLGVEISFVFGGIRKR